MTRAAWLLLSSWGFCAGGPAPAALRLLRALLGAEVRTLPWDVFARGVDHTTDPLGGGGGVAASSCRWPQTPDSTVLFSHVPPAWLACVTSGLTFSWVSQVKRALPADSARPSEALMQHLLCTS